MKLPLFIKRPLNSISLGNCRSQILKLLLLLNLGNQLFADSYHAQEWYASHDSGVNLNTSTGGVEAPGNRHALTYYIADREVALPLEIGDSVEVHFSVSFDSPAVSYTSFRLGMFDSGGVKVSASDTGFSNALFSDYRGYSAFFNLNAGTGLSIRERVSGVGDSLLNSSSSYTNHTGHSGTSFAVVDGEVYAGVLSIERTASGMNVTVSIEDIAGCSVSYTDTTDYISDFDTFAIYGASSGMSEYTLHSLSIVDSRTTILGDTFDAGERSTAALPDSAKVYASASGSSISDTSGDLVVSSGRHVITYFSEEGHGVSLNEGDLIRAYFKVSLTNPVSSYLTFRLGLFNSGGSRVDGDNQGLSSTVFENYAGYAAFFNLSQNTGLRIEEREASTSGALLHSNTPYVDHTGNSGVGFAVASGDIFSGHLLLKRVSTGVEVTVSIDGISGCSTTFLDTVDVVESFDSFAIYGASSGMSEFTLHELGVYHSGSASELWTAYQANPNTHSNLPNCSYAGYHYGEDLIPDIVGPVYDVTAYGAVGDGVADDTDEVRLALAAVGASGGVVYFPDGEYLLSEVLFVHSNDTVLRGESEAGTILTFTEPLNNGHGSYTTNSISRWSYSGGMIWFSPLSRGNTYRGAATGSVIPTGQFQEAWNVSDTIGLISAEAQRGEFSVVMSGAPVLSAGEFVLLRQTDPADHSLYKNLTGDGEWADAYDWDDTVGKGGWPNGPDLEWVVEVASYSNNVVTFKQPLRFDIRPKWLPQIERLEPLLEGSGIERMTLQFERDYAWTDENEHHYEVGWNAPYFNNAVNCWLREVTMIDMENGPNVSCGKLITLQDFTLSASATDRMEHHHGTVTRSRTHDVLIADFLIESAPWHGIENSGLSTGNVWTRGVINHGTGDTHRGGPFEGMRTDLTFVSNDGYLGGSGGPIMGARFVNWNLRLESGDNYIFGWANVMPQGAIVGLQQQGDITYNQRGETTPTGYVASCIVADQGEVPTPVNLYEAQLQYRLALDPSE